MSESATIKAAWITFAGMIVAATIAVSQVFFNTAEEAPQTQTQNNTVNVNLAEPSEPQDGQLDTTPDVETADASAVLYADISKEIAYFGPLQIEQLAFSEELPLELILGNDPIVVNFRLDGEFESELIGLTVTTELILENDLCRIYGTRQEVTQFPQEFESWHAIEGGCGSSGVTGLTLTFQTPSIPDVLVHELVFENYRIR